MAKAKRAPRKRKPEYAEPRPVLSVRLPEKVFAKLSAEAKERNVSVSEVVYGRLLQYDLYVAAAELEDPERAVRIDGLAVALESRGYRRMRVFGGTLWAEPNINIPEGSALPLHPDLETSIVAAVERGIAKALKDRKE
jgi:hypothetical protein